MQASFSSLHPAATRPASSHSHGLWMLSIHREEMIRPELWTEDVAAVESLDWVVPASNKHMEVLW